MAGLPHQSLPPTTRPALFPLSSRLYPAQSHSAPLHDAQILGSSSILPYKHRDHYNTIFCIGYRGAHQLHFSFSLLLCLPAPAWLPRDLIFILLLTSEPYTLKLIDSLDLNRQHLFFFEESPGKLW